MYAKLTKIDRESHNWSEEMKFYRSTKGIELPHFSLILKIHWKLFLILMPPRVYFLNWRYVSKISGKFQFFNGIKCSEEANHFHFSSSINFHKDLPNPNLFCIQFLPIPPHFLLIQTESSKLSNAGIKSPQKIHLPNSSSSIISHHSIFFHSLCSIILRTNRKRMLEQTVRIRSKTFVRSAGTQAWSAFGIGAFYNPPPPPSRVRNAHSGKRAVAG